MRKILVSLVIGVNSLFGLDLNVQLPNNIYYKPVSTNANLEKKDPQKEIRDKPTEMKVVSKTIQPGTKVASSDIDVDNIKSVCGYYIDLNKKNAYSDGYKYGKTYLEFYIGNRLLDLKYALDNLFPIQKLYIKGILRPPLIGIKANNASDFDNGMGYVKNDVRYKIIEKARFYKKPEKWEDFLLNYPVDTYKKFQFQKIITMNFQMNLTNDNECNNKIKQESKLAFIKGFNQAAKEVVFEFSARIDNLSRYTMTLLNYYNLYIRGVVNPPIIGSFTTPVEIKPNKDLVINEKLYRILKPASFNTDTFKWKTIIIPNEKVFIK